MSVTEGIGIAPVTDYHCDEDLIILFSSLCPYSIQSSVDEMIASTAYLDLFLRSVTEKSLLKSFLRFILLHRHDNDTILDTLLTRISSNSRVGLGHWEVWQICLAYFPLGEELCIYFLYNCPVSAGTSIAYM